VTRVIAAWRAATAVGDRDFKHAICILIVLKGQLRPESQLQPNMVVRTGSVPLPTEPYLHDEPLPGRRHPVKAASREAGARHAPALTGWRRSGLLLASR
jgi:hypothetical protein